MERSSNNIKNREIGGDRLKTVDHFNEKKAATRTNVVKLFTPLIYEWQAFPALPNVYD